MEKQDSELHNQLKAIYYNPKTPGSFSSAQNLLHAAKSQNIRVNLNQVKKFLLDQRTYTLHKSARKRFPRNPTYVEGIDYQWQADLAEMQGLIEI
jgi:ABC-type uncharacterized transport system substrate-binding protein